MEEFIKKHNLKEVENFSNYITKHENSIIRGNIKLIDNNDVKIEVLKEKDYKTQKIVNYSYDNKLSQIIYYKDGFKDYNEYAKRDKPKLVYVSTDFTIPIVLRLTKEIPFYFQIEEKEKYDNCKLYVYEYTLSYDNIRAYNTIIKNKTNGKIISKFIFLVELIDYDSENIQIAKIKTYSKYTTFNDDGSINIGVHTDKFSSEFVYNQDNEIDKFDLLSVKNFITEKSYIESNWISLDKYSSAYKLFNPTNLYELMNIDKLWAIDIADISNANNKIKTRTVYIES